MPMMVAPRTQVALVDSAIHKGLIHDLLDFLAHLVHTEHVIERVVVILQPKATAFLCVANGLLRDIYTIMV
jgi:hypothetical protein